MALRGYNITNKCKDGMAIHFSVMPHFVLARAGDLDFERLTPNLDSRVTHDIDHFSVSCQLLKRFVP